MTSITDKPQGFFERLFGAKSFIDGGLIDGPGPYGEEEDEVRVQLSPGKEYYLPHSADDRLRLELKERRDDLCRDELELVSEINTRLKKIQAVRKAIRAIDSAGGVLVAEEKPYTPIQTVVQNRNAETGKTAKQTLQHTAIVNGKPVVEDIEVDIDISDEDLADAIRRNDVAKAC